VSRGEAEDYGSERGGADHVEAVGAPEFSRHSSQFHDKVGTPRYPDLFKVDPAMPSRGVPKMPLEKGIAPAQNVKNGITHSSFLPGMEKECTC
jgi:hypothetical protein